jgi:hypothetical protein
VHVAGRTHLYVRIDDGALDPTTEQFAHGRPVVFRIWSVDDDYVVKSTFTLSEAGIVSQLGHRLAGKRPSSEGADWRRDAIEPLLGAAGLPRLLPAVVDAAEDRVAELRRRTSEELWRRFGEGSPSGS